MGMFDYVETELPLPDGFTGELQSKSFDCVLTTILIQADGRLLIKDREFESVPPNERPFPDHPRKSFWGSLRVTKERWRDLYFDGDFEFYGRDPTTEAWHSYVAKFVQGQLEYIKPADHHPGPDDAP